MPTMNNIDLLDCANGDHRYEDGSMECAVCGHVHGDETEAIAPIDRVERAKMAINAHRAAYGADWRLADLLADLRHYCDATGEQYQHEDNVAASHHAEEHGE